MLYHDLAEWLEETPNRTVMVAPRYLAGADEQDGAIERLVAEHGWVGDSDVYGGVYLASPCRRVQLAHRPQHGQDFTWLINASARPLETFVWQAEFGPDVPDEILHAFIGALTRDIAAGGDRFVAGPTLPGVAYGPLLAAGWEPTIDGKPGLLGDAPRVITAGQGTARLVHQGHLPDDTWMTPGRDCHWELRGGHPDWGTPWRATLAGRVPTHLVAALTSALADPRPVERRVSQLPSNQQPFIRVMPAEWWVPTPERALAARTRTTTPPHAPHVTAPAAATPSPMRPTIAGARR
ncbi:DUF317 domain-containing protein [Streptomyces sp. SID3343]|uniref:DUF317 domain-containing protein n=1 Tax=Streptomyces sp. SID3343 TaxID=2690260 RepID=UPI00136960EA|nr:DUF317 domain-containing protein [Streptomyces sp. SID3343]MYV97312.1 DUF317 domain-containing protein [Streptomyces sp. SID3343]